MQKKNNSKTNLSQKFNKFIDLIRSLLSILREAFLPKGESEEESQFPSRSSSVDHESKISRLKREFDKKKQDRALRQAILADHKQKIADKIDQIEESDLDLSFEDDHDLDIELEDSVESENMNEPDEDSNLEETRFIPQEQVTPESKSEEKKDTSYYRLAKNYQRPGLDLLDEYDSEQVLTDDEVKIQSETLQLTLDSFAIDAQVIGAIVGPRVTLYKILPAQGVKVENISQISQNIAMEMRAISLRILTPVPGKKYVGIEIPNNKP
ncbi:MAG: hypothetical protein KAG98_05905, partial [Lentisphaeria bacterium]|nr:hypothetical protein [Lentisphaeria bacterium]